VTEASHTFEALLSGYLAKCAAGFDPHLTRVDSIRDLLRGFDFRRRNATHAEEQQSRASHERYLAFTK